MRYFSLEFQFVISYLILIMVVYFLLNNYGYSVIYGRIAEQTESSLYTEATIISKKYLSNDKTNYEKNTSLKNQLQNLEALTGMRSWIVDGNGVILLDSTQKNNLKGKNINKKDPDFLTEQTVYGTRPANLMKSSQIAVIYPITHSLKTDGYLVVMTSAKTVDAQTGNVLKSIILCFVILFCFIALVMVFLHNQTARPIKKLTKTAKEYANGHFDYPMAKFNDKNHAELAAAITYLSNKINDVNEYQKKFLANVSHDFRSPLTSIKGYTQAIADGTIPPKLQEKYLNIILFEVERLTKLTGNLLELNQFENNGLIINIKPFDINKTIKMTAETFETQCNKKNISIDLLFDDEVLNVDADIDKIQRVIQNLLDNAIKFSHKNSVIEVHTTQKQRKVFVSVKDTGIGVKKDELDKIWDRFYKSDSSRGKDKTGTGLGLSITKEIIEAHGENINVISTENAGTEFIFSLPVHI